MKKKLLYSWGILMLFLVNATVLTAQWTKQNTGFTDANRLISQISIVDANTVWATAQDGVTSSNMIAEYTKTVDGGTTWTPGTITFSGSTDCYLTNIHAINATTAFAAMPPKGANGGKIAKTTDGGATWSATNSPDFSASWLNWVHFFDANNGVCMGDPANGEFVIYTTSNAGATWTKVDGAKIPNANSGEAGKANYYDGVGNSIWFVTGSNRVYYSSDKGLTWSVSTPGITLKNIEFRTELIGVAYGAGNPTGLSSPDLRKTFDGGKTWERLTPSGFAILDKTSKKFIGDLTNIPGTSTWFNTAGSTVYNGSSYSLDDAVTFFNVDTTATTRYTCAKFLNEQTGWAGSLNVSATDGGIYKWCSVATPTLGTITQPTSTTGTGTVVLNNLPASGTFTIERITTTSTATQVPTPSNTSNTISSLAIGRYRFRVNAGGCVSLPTEEINISSITQATNFTASNITDNSMTINWTRGNGDNVIVVARRETPVNANPVVSTSSYTGNNILGVGNSVGTQNYVVYTGTATSVNVRGLIAGTKYHYAIFENSNSNGRVSSCTIGGGGGSGYVANAGATINTSVTFSAPQLPGGVTATGTVTVGTTGTNAGKVTAIVITNNGSGYTSAPTVTITGAGTGATATAIMGYTNNYLTPALVGNATTTNVSGAPCNSFNYLAANAQNIAGTYTEITGTPITPATFVDDTASAQIGFDFNYNCQKFNTFVLNTNGYINLGKTTNKILSPATLDFNGGTLNGTNAANVNIIHAFGHALKGTAGSTSYAVSTTGTAPNRVCTVQFKNVEERTGGIFAANDATAQFDKMNFQIKLYETSNVIEIVYGDFSYTTNNLSPAVAAPYNIKSVTCGLRGSSYDNSQSLIVNKFDQKTEWSTATFSNNIVAYSGILFTNTTTYPDAKKPDLGRTFKFVPTPSNDIAVGQIYSMGEASSKYSSPQKISAKIINQGLDKKTNIAVTLTVTGATSFTETKTISALEASENTILNFSDLVLTTNGENTITISVPTDENTNNNSSVWNQTVSDFNCNYSSANGAVVTGYGGKDGGAYFVKYATNSPKSQVAKVKVFIYDFPANVGNKIQAVVLNDTKVKIGESAKYTIATTDLGKWIELPLTSPAGVTNGEFYAGVAFDAAIIVAPATTAAAYYFLGVQSEVTIRLGAYYYSTSPTDFTGMFESPSTFSARPMIGAVLSANTAGIEEMAIEAINVYPNPTDGKIQFVSPKELTDATVQLVDILGKVVYSTKMNIAKDSTTEFDFSTISKGNYIMRVNDYQTKIVINK